MTGQQKSPVQHSLSEAIVLHAPADTWRVEGGFADIFLVKPDGPRRHLLRVHAGAIVTGMGDGRSRVLCVPSGEASLQTIAARQPESPVELETWITTLASSLHCTRPRSLQLLHPGELTTLDRRPVAPSAGVLWVKSLDAPSRLLDDEHLPLIAANVLFPVAQPAWLAPSESTRYEAVTAQDALASGQMMEGFYQFAAQVRLLWEAQEAASDEQYAQRSEQNRFADVERMQEALRGLYAPLGASLPSAPMHTSNRQALYMSCFRRIGTTEHIAFHAPNDDAQVSSDTSPAEAIAHASGVRYRAVELKGAWWKGDHGPLLALLAESGSPVALLPERRGYRCFDPATGREQVVTERLARSLRQDAMSFYRPMPEGKVNGRQLAAFALDGMGEDVRRVFVFGLMSAVVALALPVITGHVFDKILPLADRGQLATVVVLVVIAAIVSSIFNLAQGSLVLRIQGRMEARVQSAMWGRLLDLPASFLRGYSVGELAARGLSVESMRRVLTGVVVRSLLIGMSSIFSFALLLHYDASLALKSLALIAFAVLFVVAISAMDLMYQRRLVESTSKLSGMTLGLVSGISKLRIASAETRAFLQWSQRYSTKVNLELKVRRLKTWMSTVTAFWAAFSIAVLFALYILELRKSLAGPAVPAAPPMTTGDFIAFLTAFGMLMRSVLGVAMSMLDLVALKPAYELARPLLETSPEISADRSMPGELTGNLELRHVSFRYEPDLPHVVRDISLRVAPGEFVAIVGSSGSGKSTLLRLLLGFEQPASGEVRYDGRDLRTLDPREVRRQIGVVLQNGRIRAGSIYENIMGGANGTVDDAWEAARMAGLDADIETMPMGMHTVMSEGGTTLSGGQRQRVLIARALVRKPKLLYFDEATSALDNHTQATVSRSLEKLSVTRVVIAHRLSTIAKADRICVMKMGDLVESGTMEELMQRGGAFADLARRQML